jgi:threonine synthase
VSEEEIVQALHDLGRIGFYVEPTAAMAGAGLTALVRAGAIDPSDRTVVVLTGGGLKATQGILQLQGVQS